MAWKSFRFNSLQPPTKQKKNEIKHVWFWKDKSSATAKLSFAYLDDFQ